ncbi:MAG: LytTR family transcriptional regulator DNA-binding domain-containing protein [Ginsengibacter sp.]
MFNLLLIQNESDPHHRIESILSERSITSAVVKSVKESVQFLSQNPNTDIILSDVKLVDGVAFEIFSYTGFQTPTIYMADSNAYKTECFSANGIDYLLKPFSESDLVNALCKYIFLRMHFVKKQCLDYNILTKSSLKWKTRVIGHHGDQNVLLKAENITLAYTQNGVVFLLANNSMKYLHAQTLSELESQLDPSVFFRANRQYLININYIRAFKSFEKVKLKVEMDAVKALPPITVSQVNSSSFKRWVLEY